MIESNHGRFSRAEECVIVLTFSEPGKVQRLYFHLVARDGVHRDYTGRTVDDDAEAAAHAIEQARLVMANDMHMGNIDLYQSVLIEDALGNEFGRVNFGDAVHFLDPWPQVPPSENDPRTVG